MEDHDERPVQKINAKMIPPRLHTSFCETAGPDCEMAVWKCFENFIASLEVVGFVVHLTHLPLYKMAAFSQKTFLVAFSWMKNTFTKTVFTKTVFITYHHHQDSLHLPPSPKQSSSPATIIKTVFITYHHHQDSLHHLPPSPRQSSSPTIITKSRFHLVFISSVSQVHSRVKPRSHIACNRSATSLRPKFRVVAGRLQGGCKEVGDWSPTGCRRLQGRFGGKEVLVAASETSLRPNRS